MTENATRFIGPDTFSALTGEPAHTSLWERPGEVLHVRLAREADVAVVVPATANVLAKLAHGLADDLLSATLLEATCPLVIAPAMHSGMWEHPATQANVAILADRGVTFVGPATGPLAHGDEGIGRLEEPEDVVAAVRGALAPHDLAGRRVVLTSGPTHEPIDPVRFLGNRSTGKMGAALAAEALGRGAAVTVVLGPGASEPPGVEVVPVQTAEEMRDAVLARFDGADVVVMAAAVADFRPKAIADEKLKKDAGVPELHLEPTPDILAELGERRKDQVLVGFAAETEDLEHGGPQEARVQAPRPRRGQPGGPLRARASARTPTRRCSWRPTVRTCPLRRWTKRELATAVMDRVAMLLDQGATGVGPGG